MEDEEGRCDRIEEASPYIDLGPEVVCQAESEGINRLVEEGAQRGLDRPLPDLEGTYGCNAPPGGLVAQDLDADGDPDLLFSDPEGFPTLYENRDGAFVEHTVGWDTAERYGRRLLSVSAVDLDGDSLPEITVTGQGLILISRNLGELTFSDWEEVLVVDDYPRTCITTASYADLDGDGDLDLVAPGLDSVPYEGFVPLEDADWQPSLGRIFLNEGGRFELWRSYGERPGFSLLAAGTDRDRDGDLDLFAPSDRPIEDFPPAAFYRNDGLDQEGKPILIDTAPEQDADLTVSAMGLAVQDLNQDGLPDYCMSDVSFQLSCLRSVKDANGGLEGYVEVADALGLSADLSAHPARPPDYDEKLAGGDFAGTIWVSWGLAMLDVDNDGLLDAAATAGPTPDSGTPYESHLQGFQPDWFWQGQADGTFVSTTPSGGWGALAWNYGLVTADFDGDGYRELVVGGLGLPPAFWSNPCGAGRWLEVDLVGTLDNAEAYGARVEVETSEGTQLQEMHNLLAVGQSDSSLHFGLGNASEATLRVTFPSGEVVEAVLPTNRKVVVRHP